MFCSGDDNGHTSLSRMVDFKSAVAKKISETRNLNEPDFLNIKVKSSMAKSLPVENLLPQNVCSIINYLQ